MSEPKKGELYELAYIIIYKALRAELSFLTALYTTYEEQRDISDRYMKTLRSIDSKTHRIEEALKDADVTEEFSKIGRQRGLIADAAGSTFGLLNDFKKRVDTITAILLDMETTGLSEDAVKIFDLSDLAVERMIEEYYEEQGEEYTQPGRPAPSKSMAEGIREAFAKSIESGLVDIEEDSAPLERKMRKEPKNWGEADYGEIVYQDRANTPPDVTKEDNYIVIGGMKIRKPGKVGRA
jgi:hypothetical protein